MLRPLNMMSSPRGASHFKIQMIMSDESTTTPASQRRTTQQPALDTPGQHIDRLLQDRSTARKRRRAAESPDQRERRLERQREYQRAYRRRKAAPTTEQTPGTSTEGEGACNSGGRRRAKRVTSATEKRAIRLQKKRVHERGSRSVGSVEHRDSRLENMRVHAHESRSVESVEHRDSRLENMRVHA